MGFASRLLFVLILLAPFVTMAATGAPHDEHMGIPWKTIGVQLFNFSALAALLIYLLRKVVVDHFADRRKSYQEMVSKAESARLEAEKTHSEITQRLNALKATSKDNATRAKAEGEALKQKLMAEARELSEKLKIDAKKTTEIELEKARNEIHRYALSEAISVAEQKLSQQTETADQVRLRSEFIEKIQAVNT